MVSEWTREEKGDRRDVAREGVSRHGKHNRHEQGDTSRYEEGRIAKNAREVKDDGVDRKVKVVTR